jgi:hypothetical protein
MALGHGCRVFQASLGSSPAHVPSARAHVTGGSGAARRSKAASLVSEVASSSYQPCIIPAVRRTERYGISGDYSARRHLHLEPRRSPFAILPRNKAGTRIPCCSKTLRRISTLMERSPNRAIRRPGMTLIFGLPRGQPTWCFVTARTRPG